MVIKKQLNKSGYALIASIEMCGQAQVLYFSIPPSKLFGIFQSCDEGDDHWADELQTTW